jgi:NTE family protein
LLSYLDTKKRPYVHLLDGGLSDNMALRGVFEGISVIGGLEELFKNAGVKQVKKLVILSVNAETSPDVNEYRSDEVPVFSRAFSSMVDIPINRYSTDTLMIMRFVVEKWRTDIRSRPPGVASVLVPDAEIYFIDASLGAIDDPVEQEYLMKIPTTLYLTDEQIDHLLAAASTLIYKDPEFQRLMKDLQRSP